MLGPPACQSTGPSNVSSSINWPASASYTHKIADLPSKPTVYGQRPRPTSQFPAHLPIKNLSTSSRSEVFVRDGDNSLSGRTGAIIAKPMKKPFTTVTHSQQPSLSGIRHRTEESKHQHLGQVKGIATRQRCAVPRAAGRKTCRCMRNSSLSAHTERSSVGLTNNYA
ncbi:unnamed protein product [Protopolystoma xenopodis]|uniref:Uncharacterized protein n=1 Tax=Protopolystoma xenopodis TaxID=117903 RepID=A0A448WWM7_9PLAT|nr:unnamed protein product [Protopolystoma xenopodis]